MRLLVVTDEAEAELNPFRSIVAKSYVYESVGPEDFGARFGGLANDPNILSLTTTPYQSVSAFSFVCGDFETDRGQLGEVHHARRKFLERMWR